MKKIVLTLVVFCTIAGSIQAQKITPGIKGGLNIADISNVNGDNRISGHVGFFLHDKINHFWAIQPELLYSGEGQKYMAGGSEYTIALSYLQIPFMFQFYPIRQFYVEFGPEMGFLMAANLKYGDNKTEIDDNYKKVAFSLGLGAGIQATRMLGFYARYNGGLSDITKNDSRNYFNRVVQVGLSVRRNKCARSSFSCKLKGLMVSFHQSFFFM
jgi:hypothetical protein